MPAPSRGLNRPIVAIIAVAAIAGGIRLWGLSQPADLVFDELYYAKAGCVFIGGSDTTCRVESDDEHYWVENKWDMGSWVHPPLGKWMTGMGIKAFGMSSFGWRLPSALSGTLVAVMVALIAQLLFARPVWTFVAGTLIALDGINVVMSRVAMLDVHLSFWIVLGFLCLVLDRRWIDRRTPELERVRGASRRRRSRARADAAGALAAVAAVAVRAPAWRSVPRSRSSGPASPRWPRRCS